MIIKIVLRGLKMSIMVFFVPKQGSKMRRTIKEQKDKYEETEREVSVLDE